MTSKKPARKSISLLDLPPEVRHQIYKHLFCNRAWPIPLGSGTLAPLQLQEKNDLLEPIFHTALFRVSKAISTDALRFAYGANSFQLPADLTSFCQLGLTALASIRTLTVYNNCWLVGRESSTAWEILNYKCSALELLVVQPSTHLLWQAIPRLKEYVASFDNAHDLSSRPKLVFDLYIFDRHFSFDLPEREYRRALQELKGVPGSNSTRQGFMPVDQMVSLLPKHVKRIDFVLDVSAGGIRALEEVLQESSDLPLVKVKLPSPDNSYRLGSRARLCYVWDENLKK
ncbi:hypothetical protein LTS15_004150 [Exophiala xenobiotica]|nr:hypothetical protein LTS15_004150 [Exophiala xenobiotica]